MFALANGSTGSNILDSSGNLLAGNTDSPPSNSGQLSLSSKRSFEFELIQQPVRISPVGLWMEIMCCVAGRLIGGYYDVLCWLVGWLVDIMCLLCRRSVGGCAVLLPAVM